MIEKKFVAQKKKEYQVKVFLNRKLPKAGLSKIELEKTPLGMKVIIHTSKPGLVVGRRGMSLNSLKEALKTKFGLENPQIEIRAVEEPLLDAQIVASLVANRLERYGTSRFRGIGHRIVQSVIDAGAAGVEVRIAGKIQGSMSSFVGFRKGYLPKCGQVAIDGVDRGYALAVLKAGLIGVSVTILKNKEALPDLVFFKDVQEEVAQEEPAEEAEEPLEKAEGGVSAEG